MVVSAEKVVLLQLGDDWDGVFEVLTDPDARGPRLPASESHFRVNVRDNVATKHNYRLCLVTSGTLLVALGLIRAERRSGDLDILVRVDHVMRLLGAVDLTEVVRNLPQRLRTFAAAALPTTAVLGERTAEALLHGLQNLSGEADEALLSLRQQILEEQNRGERSQATAELHDALALGLRIAGFSRGTLGGRVPPIDSPPVSYFAILEAGRGRDPSEAAMIRHDATHFGDWVPADATVLDVVGFTDPNDPSRRVTVLYADKEAEERHTGADLIYFRAHFPGFVLVQYKRMRRQGPGDNSSYGYRPDAQLAEEIRRMRNTLAAIPAEPPAGASDPAAWRLHSQPHYIKLVQEGRARPPGGDLIKGMYFPLDLFELLLGSTAVRGPGKTRPLNWDNVGGRYLTNTTFLSLLQGGWIGSAGLATDHLQSIVSEIWATGQRALVIRDESPAPDRLGGPLAPR